MCYTINHRHSPVGLRTLARSAAAAVVGVAIAGFAATPPVSAQTAGKPPAQTAASANIPALGSIDFAWLSFGVHWFDPPPGSGHGPIRQDPTVPYHGNLDGPGVRVTIGRASCRERV